MATDDSDPSKKSGATKPETISKIKSGMFSRGFALAKMTASTGMRAASVGLASLSSKKDEKIKAILIEQAKSLSGEFGQLKGTLMKGAQALSMYGEYFLPREANEFLKKLQSQSPPVEWPEMYKILVEELGEEKLTELEIETDSFGAASLGQVHRARRKSDGLQLAVKIQYPGVEKAIDWDLSTIRRMLGMMKLVPKGEKFNLIFDEVKRMLLQEVDYEAEARLTREYAECIKGDSRFVMPEVVGEFSTGRVLTTTFQEGVGVDSEEVAALSLERRSRIASNFLDLYFNELFGFGLVQTDPHFGNYRIRIDPKGENDQVVLLDFGAVRKMEEPFASAYLRMVQGCVIRDADILVNGFKEVGFLSDGDPATMEEKFVRMSFLVGEPFHSSEMAGVHTEFFNERGEYRWGASDLPKRVAQAGTELLFATKLKPPPREVVFLDRKLGGVFVFLSVLNAEFSPRLLLERYFGDTVG